MCTMIVVTKMMSGVGKGPDGWFPIKEATVGYDHASHSTDEHALLIDFVNYDIDTSSRVAVELDLASGRALVEQLTRAIKLAEESHMV